MTPLQYSIIVGVIAGFTIMEFVLHRAQHFGATAGDNVLDMLGFALLAIFTQPTIMWVSSRIGLAVVPQYQNALADLPWYAMVGLLLVGDDMMQYWWHRLSHSPLLWPLHRAHHSAHYMSARIIYRNNFFYYVGMPAIWFSGFLVYLGLGPVFLIYIVVKMAVITGAHSSARWDEPLYKVKALRPLMWLVQRTISTPTTHFAHHAMSNADGIGHYTGNYGNLLFFWDVLFGSAHITQQYPAKVGLKDDELFGPEKWWIELFYPVFRSRRTHSALVPGGTPYDDHSEPQPSLSTTQPSL
jgi:sterol desaturase/sphingolipid hydroxylase (fatty acid hydroxylase superfamily)